MKSRFKNIASFTSFNGEKREGEKKSKAIPVTGRGGP
jgi:hypothetical protein